MSFVPHEVGEKDGPRHTVGACSVIRHLVEAIVGEGVGEAR